MLKVSKFGGSSVAGAEQFQKVRSIVEADEGRRIVVISAAGKRTAEDHKLTDLLYLCDAHLTYGVSCQEILSEIRSRFAEIASSLALSYDAAAEFDAFSQKLKKGFPVDELVSRGEYFTARMMAEYLGFQFMDAADCIFFTVEGVLDREKTYAAIAGALEKYGRILIPGFYGALPSGKIRVMSRGGSDITGAVAAAAVKADVYENWTDVSGILMADPRIVPNPRAIPKLTFQELHELAYAGASVLHEDSVAPCMEAGIPLNIRNTNAPDDLGTMIVDAVEDEEFTDDGRFITGITGRSDVRLQGQHPLQPVWRLRDCQVHRRGDEAAAAAHSLRPAPRIPAVRPGTSGRCRAVPLERLTLLRSREARRQLTQTHDD